MTIYKTNTAPTPTWTRNGAQAANIRELGTFVDLSGLTRTIRERTMYEIISPDSHSGLYIEMKFLDMYVPEEPPMPPPTPDEVEFRWKNAAGEIIITEIWQKKP